MFALFRSLTDRIKALFVTTAALDFEADLAVRHAERKAELLRRAAAYDEEGLHVVAKELRHQADVLSIQRPLASVLPSVEHLQADREGPLFISYEATNNGEAHGQPRSPKKKGART